MALAARCPHCDTTFKVVRDQLLLRDGWVRCGHCGEPFNARENLLEQVPPAINAAEEPVTAGEPPSTVPSETVTVPTVEPAVELPASEPAEEDAGVSILPDPDSQTARPQRPPSSVADHAFLPPPLPAAVGPAAPIASGAAAPEAESPVETVVGGTELMPTSGTPDEAWATTNLPTVEAQGEAAGQDADAGPPSAFDLGEALNYQFDAPGQTEPLPIGADAGPAGAVEPEFVRHARRQAAWRSRPMRVALAFGASLLAVALALQAAWFWHDPLAQALPAWRPALQQLCNLTTGCRIAAPRDLDALVIDSSALNPSPDGLVLTVLLRNRAGRAVAYPALDLTLTDLQGRIDVRKVIGPAQYLPPPQSDARAIAAGLAGGQQMQLQLRLHTPGTAPAGYRVAVFYP